MIDSVHVGFTVSHNLKYTLEPNYMWSLYRELRLVLNLRYVNQFLHVLTFKYEDLHVAALMLKGTNACLNLTSYRVITMWTSTLSVINS